MNKYRHGDIIGGVAIGTASDNWRKTIGEHLTDLRLTTIPPRPGNGPEAAIFRAGIAEILSLRLRIAYAPIFAVLERIEKKIGVLADLRREPWAPAAHEVNRMNRR